MENIGARINGIKFERSQVQLELSALAKKKSTAVASACPSFAEGFFLVPGKRSRAAERWPANPRLLGPLALRAVPSLVTVRGPSPPFLLP